MKVRDASFGKAMGASIQGAHRQLAERWLERLVALVPVEPNAVFTTTVLLDHIPSLIDEIGKFVSAPTDEDIAAKTIVIDKARELGELRHRQQASVHQVLREYDLLADVIEEFLIEKTRTLALAPEPTECLEISRRVGRAVRVLMQITAVRFITEYTETITDQAQRLDRFNRSISHELRNVLGTLQFGAALFENGATQHNHADLQRLAPIVGRNVERAVKIIRSFERLPHTGIIADKPNEQVVQVTELVQEVFRQLQDMSDARGVELRVATSPAVLYVDTGALELILMNLVSNAIKYCDQRKPQRFAEITGAEREQVYGYRCGTTASAFPATPSQASSSASSVRTQSWTRSSASKELASGWPLWMSASSRCAARSGTNPKKALARRSCSQSRRSFHRFQPRLGRPDHLTLPRATRPLEDAVWFPAIDNPIGRDPRKARMGDGIVGHEQLACLVSIAVEGEKTPSFKRR